MKKYRIGDILEDQTMVVGVHNSLDNCVRTIDLTNMTTYGYISGQVVGVNYTGISNYIMNMVECQFEVDKDKFEYECRLMREEIKDLLQEVI